MCTVIKEKHIVNENFKQCNNIPYEKIIFHSLHETPFVAQKGAGGGGVVKLQLLQL